MTHLKKILFVMQIRICNKDANDEIDIDGNNSFEDIKACHYAKGKFYILANKCGKMRGIFLIEIDEQEMKKHGRVGRPNFIIKWWN